MERSCRYSGLKKFLAAILLLVVALIEMPVVHAGVVVLEAPAVNSAPTFDATPMPTFQQGVAASYPVAVHADDPDSDPLTITENGQALLSGITWDAANEEYDYDGIGAVGSTCGHVATADDGTVTTDSNAFCIQIIDSLLGDGDLSNGEAWGDINFANRVCSEPFTATDYIDQNGNSSLDNPVRSGTLHWNPNDTTSNECGVEQPGRVSQSKNWLMTPSDHCTFNNPPPCTAVNAEAYGHLPNRIVEFTPRFRGPPDRGPARGTNYNGVNIDSVFPEFSDDTGRLAIRWYLYYHNGFEFTSGCDQNSKIWDAIIGRYWTNGHPNLSHANGSHGWTSDNAGISQCGLLKMKSDHGDNGVEEITTAWYQGSWIRYEVVVTNVEDRNSDPGDGNGVRIQLYVHNVTKESAEQQWIDSFNQTTSESPWTNTHPGCPRCNNTDWGCGGQTDVYRPGQDFSSLRQSSYGQACADDATPDTQEFPHWKGMHYMFVAKWTQAEMAGFDVFGADVWDQTQFRIGPAWEMEGCLGVNCTP